MSQRIFRRAATLLDERADVLWCKYKTYRYGKPWDTVTARNLYYEHKCLAKKLREMADTVTKEGER